MRLINRISASEWTYFETRVFSKC